MTRPATITFHPSAHADADDAVDYYNAINPQLAHRLRHRLDDAIDFIQSFPQGGSLYFDVYRHVGLPPFPFAVVYVSTAHTAHVLAVADLRMDPATISAGLEHRRADEEGDHGQAAA